MLARRLLELGRGGGDDALVLLLGVLGGELLGLLHFGVGFGELEAECLGQVGVEANAGELLLGGLGVDARAECHEANGLEVKLIVVLIRLLFYFIPFT